MKGLESGQDKVKQICDVLKKETLEPARQEADHLLITARQQADTILSDARVQATAMIDEARLAIEGERKTFQVAILQACRQALEALKEQIEENLFNPELSRLMTQPLRSHEVIAQLISTMIEAIKKEGLNTSLSVAISSSVSPRAINELLSQEVLNRLREKGVVLSSIGGGIEVKLVEDKITFDLSNKALEELVFQYIRQDFKNYIFKT